MRHGHGEMHFPDGIKYVGGFVDDCMHGEARLVYTDGSVEICEFKNDQKVDTTTQ